MLPSMESQGTVDVTDEDRLLERARSGDRQAFEELMTTHLQRVWRVVWSILRHAEDTEDVVQEVFLAAHRSLATYRGDSRFSTWLHRIAVNRALNHRDRMSEKVRRDSRPLEDESGPLEIPDGSSSPLRELEMKELKRKLSECMERIPPAWRAVLALKVEGSLSYEEIAGAVGIAVGTVRSRLARARLALRRCVEGET